MDPPLSWGECLLPGCLALERSIGSWTGPPAAHSPGTQALGLAPPRPPRPLAPSPCRSWDVSASTGVVSGLGVVSGSGSGEAWLPRGPLQLSRGLPSTNSPTRPRATCSQGPPVSQHPLCLGPLLTHKCL